MASQALSAMEVSCRASLGPVSKREVTAGADHSAPLVPQPLCQPRVPPGDCYGAALSQGKRESAAASSEHRQWWFLLPPQKSCLLFPVNSESLFWRALPVSTGSFRSSPAASVFAFCLKIPAWNFPRLADWAPSCYTPPEPKLSSFPLPPCF